MAAPVIKSCVLIESPASESDEQFRTFVTELLASIYRHTDSLEFSVGRRVWWRDIQFREFICIAGSVSGQLILQASRPPGISRAVIVYGSSLTGNMVSHEIRSGVETKFDPDELQVA
jgi:hypothetical protein